MQYREIVAVTGLGGLYHLLSTKSDGAIVRSLADDTTRFIPSRLHNVTPLESIEIYTTGSNVRLHEVLQKMQESELSRPGTKAAPAEIRTYFSSVFPDIDEDRVYTSDMKKMLKWFDILQGANLLDFSGLDAGGEGAEEESAATEPVEAEAQVAAHNKADAAAEVSLAEEAMEKPAKKSRAKKAVATEDGAEGASAEAAAPKKTAAKKAAKPKKEDSEESSAE